MNVNSQRAFEYIRKKILSGEYAPGHVLMTEYLSAEIGVSRTPVREALHELRAEGLVTIRPRVGASVKSMDQKEFEELCDLRTAVEGHAAGLAAMRWTEPQLREIRFALEAMRELTHRSVTPDTANPVLNELVREDVRFHIGIITAAQNQLMKQEILRMHLINRVVAGARTPESTADVIAARDSVQASHEAIFDALTRRDASAAERAMKQHINEIVEKVLRRMSRRSVDALGRELTPEELVYGA